MIKNNNKKEIIFLTPEIEQQILNKYFEVPLINLRSISKIKLQNTNENLGDFILSTWAYNNLIKNTKLRNNHIAITKNIPIYSAEKMINTYKYKIKSTIFQVKENKSGVEYGYNLIISHIANIVTNINNNTYVVYI